MHVRVGTSGFGFTEWKGTFYPKGITSDAMLGYYAERLPTVEINNTFYKLPTADVVASWAARAAPAFRFTLKATQFITHRLRLKDPAESVARFWGLRESLGDKRGPVLVQLPPNMKKDLGRLETFLAALPAEHMASFEFRHESWLTDDVYAALAKNGAALVAAETDEAPATLVRTGSFGYFRLRKEEYDGAALDRWAEAITREKWSEAFVYFKHEDAAKGPRFAAELQRRLA